jgi:hypothetical protein
MLCLKCGCSPSSDKSLLFQAGLLRLPRARRRSLPALLPMYMCVWWPRPQSAVSLEFLRLMTRQLCRCFFPCVCGLLGVTALSAGWGFPGHLVPVNGDERCFMRRHVCSHYARPNVIAATDDIVLRKAAVGSVPLCVYACSCIVIDKRTASRCLASRLVLRARVLRMCFVSQPVVMRHGSSDKERALRISTRHHEPKFSVASCVCPHRTFCSLPTSRLPSLSA